MSKRDVGCNKGLHHVRISVDTPVGGLKWWGVRNANVPISIHQCFHYSMFVCLRHDAASIEGDKLTNKIISNNTNATINDTYITFGCGDEDVWKKHLHKNLSIQVPRIYLTFENTNCHDAASIEGDKLTNKIISNNTNATINDTYITFGCGDEDVWKKHLHKNLSIQVPRIYLTFENTNCLEKYGTTSVAGQVGELYMLYMKLNYKPDCCSKS